ncbi:hypothetical protein OsI_25543 [Oryza sativa Indica Group]|uniref:Uncharacterized protein n=1 Tax=Oryza sativa subsp. indica TaxID=39946 RepID=A2YJZ0_ORYSI|nr:hypothetical protein OsI_25543 [Oryza sativa Indica Group]
MALVWFFVSCLSYESLVLQSVRRRAHSSFRIRVFWTPPLASTMLEVAIELVALAQADLKQQQVRIATTTDVAKATSTIASAVAGERMTMPVSLWSMSPWATPSMSRPWTKRSTSSVCAIGARFGPVKARFVERERRGRLLPSWPLVALAAFVC